MSQQTAGARFRAAIQQESPLQVMGAITAYAGLMAKRTGYKALYLSGGGLDARIDAGFVIMARTDAAAVEGIDSAIERAQAYVEAGADMIFPEAMKTLEDYRRFKQAVKVPILANLTEFGSTPFFTTDELRDAGVDIALYCCGAYRAMNKAAMHFYETVRREGTQKNIIDTLQTRAELYDFLEYHAYEDRLDALFAHDGSAAG
jgi:methylisocitrate lyase